MKPIQVLIVDDHAILRAGLRLGPCSQEDIQVGGEAGGAADAAAPCSPLSRREQEVLERLVHGYTNQETADRLFLSVKTIETYRARLMAKLEVKSRAELVRYAAEHGLIGPVRD